MNSIRSKLLVYIVIGAALALLITGLVIDRLLYSQLAKEFDRNLLETASNLVSLAEQDEGVIEFDYEPELMPQFARETQPLYFQLWRDDGEILSASPSLGDAELNHASLTNSNPEFADLILPDGRVGRSVAFGFVPFIDLEQDEDEPEAKLPPDNPLNAYLVVARGTEELRALAFRFRAILGGAFLTLMLALLLVIRTAVTSGLKPLNNIADQVNRLDEQSLHQRITLSRPTLELTPIKDQLNHLLDRLDQAFRREKRFSGNVAHELRTPIAELRALAEVGREWPTERDMVEGFFGDLVDIANDMERTVANLLTLARVDAGDQVVVASSISLRDLFDKLSQRFEDALVERDQTIDNQIPHHMKVRSDVEKLTLILVNLLSNAVNYGDRHSIITVKAIANDKHIEVDITNATNQLTEDDLPLMCERFWRKDTARTKRNNAGIGLSLVAALADVLGITIQPRLERDRQFTLSLIGLQAA